jgi:hypothetical protein
MPLRQAGQVAMQVWLAALALLASTAGFAEPAQPSRISVEIGVGHESQSAPLIQISPESTVIYLPGLQRLGGSHVRTSVQGFAGAPVGGDVSATVSGDATLKHSPGSPDLDFLSLSLQPMLHLPVGAASVGVGLNLQRMDVARQHFRTTRGVQANWTLPASNGLWAVVADAGRYRHPGDLADLDARAVSLVLQRQFTRPLPGLDGADVSAIVGRERNGRGFRELSHRSAMLSASAQWTWLGAGWSAGGSLRRARFDDTAFDGEPPRDDRTTLFDLSAQWPLSPRQSLRVEFNDVRNASNARLYDNRYRQLAVALRTDL